MIAIVDYGAGNLNSVKKAFDHLRADVVVTNRNETVAAADKVVLPGVGHFSSLRALKKGGLIETLIQGIQTGKLFLGICLGMQWLFDGSEECGEIPGAGLLPGKCQKFASDVKSPHVGWNSLEVAKSSRLLRDVVDHSFVYYTHSFHAPLTAETSATCSYGDSFAAAVERDNIFGVQFHPEKSGDVGLSILKTFCEI